MYILKSKQENRVVVQLKPFIYLSGDLDHAQNVVPMEFEKRTFKLRWLAWVYGLEFEKVV